MAINCFIRLSCRTNNQWQTSVSEDICVNWKGRFLNTAMKQNNFLSTIKPDTASAITGHYEQTTGVLPVSGTDNVDGVVKFEVSDREEGGEVFNAPKRLPSNLLCK